MLEAGFKYFTQNKLYIWKKGKNKTSPPAPLLAGEGGQRPGEVYGNRLSGSKLRDLAWSLDVLDLSKGQKRQL